MRRARIHQTQFRIPAARFARVLPEDLRPSVQRAWGMPGAQRTRSRACSVESTRVSHREVTGKSPGIPARDGVNGFLRALPGDRALLPPSLRELPAKLDASVGASGPHDFAVRVSTFRQIVPSASTASRPALMTLRNAPLSGRDTRSNAPDLPDGESKIFLQSRLDTILAPVPVGQITLVPFKKLVLSVRHGNAGIWRPPLAAGSKR
jgi:hypothetical protein